MKKIFIGTASLALLAFAGSVNGQAFIGNSDDEIIERAYPIPFACGTVDDEGKYFLSPDRKTAVGDEEYLMTCVNGQPESPEARTIEIFTSGDSGILFIPAANYKAHVYNPNNGKFIETHVLNVELDCPVLFGQPIECEVGYRSIHPVTKQAFFTAGSNGGGIRLSGRVNEGESLLSVGTIYISGR